MPIKVIQKVGEGGQTKIGWLWIQEEGVDFLVFWRKSQMNDPFVKSNLVKDKHNTFIVHTKRSGGI